MSKIENIYREIYTDISESEFREAVKRKMEEMGGLVTERAAAKLVAEEFNDSRVVTISNIEAELDLVQFVAMVDSVGELRTFARDDGEGCVINVTVADETGNVRLTFWDERAVAAKEELAEGDVLRVWGNPRSGYDETEIKVVDIERADANIDVIPGVRTIDTLTREQSEVTIRGVVFDMESINYFTRDDESIGMASSLVVCDKTGCIPVLLWDERAEDVRNINTGRALEIADGYIRQREDELILNVGSHGQVKEIEEPLEYAPETTEIEAVEINQTVNIAGVISSVDPIRTFERDDGSKGQLRFIQIVDDTDEIGVTLWGEQADLEPYPGEKTLILNAEVHDSWGGHRYRNKQVSVLHDSMVTFLDDTRSPRGLMTNNETGSKQSDQASAGKYVKKNSENSASDSTYSNDPSSFFSMFPVSVSLGATEEKEMKKVDNRHVEFTGTVVQTGSPAIIDNGTEALTIETNAHLRLGEEITVRGRFEGDVVKVNEIN